MLGGGPRKLGIEYMEIGEQLAGYFKLVGQDGRPGDARSTPTGPAGKAGMKAGDVVLKLGSEAIEDGDDLRDAVSAAEGGQEVTVTVQRDGRPVDLKVTLAKPEPSAASAASRAASACSGRSAPRRAPRPPAPSPGRGRSASDVLEVEHEQRPAGDERGAEQQVGERHEEPHHPGEAEAHASRPATRGASAASPRSVSPRRVSAGSVIWNATARPPQHQREERPDDAG